LSEFKLSTQSRFIILTAVLASLLEIVDTSIVNVAIPTMMGNLGATLEDISWVVTGYIIANAIVLPLSGWLGSQIGRRKYYVGCIIVFTVASVLCGIAPNLTALTIFRVIQGFAGGALLPTSQTLIQEQFPRERAGMGSAIYGMSIMIGPTLGPTLGGYLTDHYGWRSIFNINLPLGLIAIFLALIYVEEPAHSLERKKKAPIDGVGLGLLAVGVGCLQYVLERGQADDWFDSTGIQICSLIAGLTIPSFVYWELKVEHPIVNLRLFRDSVVRNGTLLMMCLGLMLFGLIFVLPIFVGTTLHYDATQTGMLFIPGALTTAACMPFVGMMLRKIDPRYLILFGVFVVEGCLYLMTQFSSQSGERELFWALLVRGLGLGFLFVPINTAVLGQFRGESLGQVAGLLNLFRQLGGSIGIALIGTLLDRRNRQNYIDVVSHVSLLSPATDLTLRQTQSGMMTKLGGEVGFAAPSAAALRSLGYRVQAQVFMMSFVQLMWTLLIIFGFSLIPLYFLKVDKKVEGPVDAH